MSKSITQPSFLSREVTAVTGTRNAACLKVIYLTFHQGLDRKSLTRSDLLLDGEIGPDTANDMAVSGGS